MHRHLVCTLWSAATAAALFAGCGEVPPQGEAPRCLNLRAHGDPAVTLPARISLLFTVDTCAGEPVPGLSVSDFSLSENGSPISAYESRMTLMPRTQAHRTYAALLIDMSGSMLHSGAWPELRAAVERFLDEVLKGDDGHQVALLTFDGRAQPTEWVPYTADRAKLAAALDALEIRECTTNVECASLPDRATCAAWRCVDDSTNLYGAVAAGARHVAAAVEAEERPFRQGALVIFTDGTDQAARATREEAESALKSASVLSFAVGLGGEVDDDALRALGRQGHFSADRPEALGAAFHAVAGRLTALAGRFYALDYCSPKRQGRHTLTLQGRWMDPHGEELRGSLEARFDATGFGSGCDLPAQ